MAVTSFFRNVLSRPSKDAQANGKSSSKAEAQNLSLAQSIKPSSKDKADSCLVTESTRLSANQSTAAYYKFLFADKNQEELSVPQKLVMESVRDSLLKKDYRANAIPRLPMVIPKLLRSLRDPETSAKDYVEIVNKDPVMCAAVLKLANSVYFNPIGAYIGDIERAIVKLGISGLRSVLSAAVMQPIIQRDSAYYSLTGQRLWMHSLNCAVACEIVGQNRELERFKVYLLGLIHDIGQITIFSELCKQHSLNGDPNPSSKAFVPLMRKMAPLLSYLIAQDWKLPDEICTALKEQVDIASGKKVSPYALLLFQANTAAEAYAFLPRDKRGGMKQVLGDLDMPLELFDRLDQVSTQI